MNQPEQPREEMEQQYGFLSEQRPSDDFITLERIDKQRLVADIVRNSCGVEIEIRGDRVEFHETDYQEMNLTGAKEYYNWLRSALNSVSTLTNFDKNQIAFHVKGMSNKFQKWVFKNYKRFGMSKEKPGELTTRFLLLIDAQLNQARDGEMNRSITEQRQISTFQHQFFDKKGRPQQAPKEGVANYGG